MNITKIEGHFNGHEATRIALISSRFNYFIVHKLESGALDMLRRHGVQQVDIYYVPGALEVPLCAAKLAAGGKYDALIALGVVIRGATPHFDVVIGESAKGLSSVALQHGLPVLNGILTTNNIEQAVERAGTKAGNKGADCAVAALEMVSLLRKL